MFKSARWRADKSKITALFKLRFHASQVSHLGGNALVLSLVPADTGRPTAKLDKFEIRDGCCYWENPIVETVKLIHDPKTGKLQERIIYFIISTGSSKLSVLGEVSVNIAEYAEATEAASVSLPFKGSSTDIILHVLIQRIQENVTNQRELEECFGVKVKPEEDYNLKRHFSNGDAEENISVHSIDEQSLRKAISNTAELNHNRRRASIGSDITLSSSDSSSGLNTPRDNGMKNNILLLDSVAHNQGPTGWELALVPTHDLSKDGSTNSPRNGFPNGRSELAGDNTVNKLKSDLVLLSRKAEVADIELQTLRKQIVKESKRGQDLVKEVASLKEEREALKEECEKLKASQKSKDELKARNKLNYEEDSWTLLEETKQELNYVKDLNVNLQLQLQKTQESNSELIFAVQDLEELLEQSKSGRFDISAQPGYDKIPEVLEKRCIEEQGQSDNDDDDEEQKALEEIVRQHSDAKESYILEQKIMDLCSEIEMYRRDKDEVEIQLEQLALDYEILKQENHDLSYKLDQTHGQEQLKLQYQCSSSYAIINELENRVQKLERELKERSDDFSGSLAKIKELENHIQCHEDELEKQAQGFKNELEVVTRAKVEKEQEAFRLAKLELKNRIEKLEEMQSKEYSDALATVRELENEIQFLETELDKQAQGFESDLEVLTCAKVEQEHRAIKAEEALRLVKWKNASTAERIQDEFRRLYMQMQLTFEANEKSTTNAKTEASKLRLVNKHLEDLLQEAKEELQSVKDDYEAQVLDLHNQLSSKSKQIDQFLLEIEEKSSQLKLEGEFCQSLSAELLTLRAEIDSLMSDTSSLGTLIEEGTVLKAELEELKVLVKERDLLGQREKGERENLTEALNLAKKDAEKSTEELNAVKCLKNEKDIELSNLKSEVDTLRAQCEELRHSLHMDELIKGKLREQVIQLEAELEEKELKKNDQANNLEEHIKLLEVQIEQKDAALETSENAFHEKETDLHNKIEELETRLDEISCENECQKVESNNSKSKMNDDSLIPEDYGNAASINKTEANGMETSISTDDSLGDQNNVSALLKEMASLRDKNSSMEYELKEMQERYSEISLKFAEVEGERQKLMMTVRSMKNSKKR